MISRFRRWVIAQAIRWPEWAFPLPPTKLTPVDRQDILYWNKVAAVGFESEFMGEIKEAEGDYERRIQAFIFTNDFDSARKVMLRLRGLRLIYVIIAEATKHSESIKRGVKYGRIAAE